MYRKGKSICTCPLIDHQIMIESMHHPHHHYQDEVDCQWQMMVHKRMSRLSLESYNHHNDFHQNDIENKNIQVSISYISIQWNQSKHWKTIVCLRTVSWVITKSNNDWTTKSMRMKNRLTTMKLWWDQHVYIYICICMMYVTMNTWMNIWMMNEHMNNERESTRSLIFDCVTALHFDWSISNDWQKFASFRTFNSHYPKSGLNSTNMALIQALNLIQELNTGSQLNTGA